MSSSNSKPKAKWLEKYHVSDESHIPDLDMGAGINEFKHKMPRHEAEKKAHEDYTRERVLESAAHHYSGMKAAKATGDQKSATQHSAMFITALKYLGHPSVGELPEEIKNKLKSQPSKVYNFKGHGSDVFLGSEKPEHKADSDKIEEEFEGKGEEHPKESDAKRIAKTLIEKAKAKLGIG